MSKYRKKLKSRVILNKIFIEQKEQYGHTEFLLYIVQVISHHAYFILYFENCELKLELEVIEAVITLIQRGASVFSCIFVFFLKAQTGIRLKP